MAALVVHDVLKRFGDFLAVDRLSLHVEPGELVGFLGPNGAGKTTTLRMVMNILAPDAGTIDVRGRPSATDVKDRVGYLPGERGLYRKMTVEATLRYFGKLKGLGGRKLTRAIDEGLTRVGLRDRKRSRVEALSKGMQQKLQFVATLLHDPELVILDAPFSGLDPLNRDMLEGLLTELRGRGVAVLFSTHVMEQAERLCDRIVLINRGRKLIEGTLAEARALYPTRTVELEGRGDFGPLSAHADVVSAQVAPDRATLELRDGVGGNGVLQAALACGQVTRFELRQPTLQEIFVHLVEGDARA